MHVDAASGGFVAPFLQPDLEWDFRLPIVKSINVSGHKYGLTYPGVGFVVWRDQEDLPEDLVFHVNYLGGDMPTFTLNFSRPGNQIVGQYYNFIRLGPRRLHADHGDAAGHRRCRSRPPWRRWARSSSSATGPTSPCSPSPLRDPGKYTVFDVSNRMRQYGWQLPAYTMPADAEDLAVLRVVVREGFSADLGDKLLDGPGRGRRPPREARPAAGRGRAGPVRPHVGHLPLAPGRR